MATVQLLNGERDEEGNVLVVFSTLQSILKRGGATHIGELVRAAANRGHAVDEHSRQVLLDYGLVDEHGCVTNKSIRDIVNSAVVTVLPSVTLVWPVEPTK